MEGQRIECDRPLVIGREDAGEGVDFMIDDPEMSRRHAVVTPVGDGLEIEDLGSLNGTFVNGTKISGTVSLAANAEVKIGTTTFTVDLPAPLPPPSSPTVMSPVVPPPSDEPVAPVLQPTVARGMPIVPDAGAATPADEPVAPVLQPTVARSTPIVPDAGAVTPSDEPVAPVLQPTVARSTPIVPDPSKTAVRDQPLIPMHEPTVVRDVVKGLPTPGTGGGPAAPAAPAGPPAKIPKPVLMVMRSPAGKVLLPIMLKLPPKARPLVPMLFLLLFVAGNAVGIYFVVSAVT